MLRVVPVALILVCVSLAAVTPTTAQPAPQRVAVLDLANPAGLTAQETDYLTSLIRAAARRSLRTGRFVIMTRENIFDLLGDQDLAGCIGECAVETGRNLGAAYVVAGEVVKFGPSLRVNLTMHETATGNLLESVQVGGDSVLELESALTDGGRDLFRPLRGGVRRTTPGREVSLGGQAQAWSADSESDVIVRFESEPAGALVEVDGVPLCETPCSRPLRAGTAEVAFKLLRYLPSSQLVEVSADMPPVRAQLTANFGWLTVTTEPAGLAVEVDGKRIGITPITRRELSLGSHEVWVRDVAWHDVGERVMVEQDEHQEVHLVPRPVNGGLKVQATDARGNAVPGEVLIDGQVAGTTWSNLTIQAGARLVRVQAEAGTWQGTVDVPRQELLTLNVEVGVPTAAAPSPLAGPTGAAPVGADSMVNSQGMRLMRIPAGTFVMGSPAAEQGRDPDEQPHTVRLTQSFWLGATEVTQDQYQAVRRKQPSRFKGAANPVERVSWFDCIRFCNRLSELEGLQPAYTITRGKVTWNRSADGYRLPTEAEWEYACRAGTTTRFQAGDEVEDLKRVGWFQGNASGHPHAVGQKQANAWGLFDMHGNVWEWCWDRRAAYPEGPVTDPVGPDKGKQRVMRGGAWINAHKLCRAADRTGNEADYQSHSLGFRVARTVMAR